jgi:hypothetical protein
MAADRVESAKERQCVRDREGRERGDGYDGGRSADGFNDA